MIKANELRIGNYFKGIGGVQTVLSLEENTDRGRLNYSSEQHRLMYSHLILCHQNGNQYKPFEIEGILLTEEILLKCGFQKVNTVYQVSIGKSNVFHLIVADDICIVGLNGPFGLVNQGSLSFLHQLQNLYFALTGKDLVYTP